MSIETMFLCECGSTHCHDISFELESELSAAKASESRLLADNDALAFKVNMDRSELAVAKAEIETRKKLDATWEQEYGNLESELASAKAEIERMKEAYRKLDCELDVCLGYRSENESLLEARKIIGKDLEKEQNENKRLRETIQRNEDRSVECERLRGQLQKIGNRFTDCDGINGPPCFQIAQSALDGKGGEACAHSWLIGKQVICTLCGYEDKPGQV